MAGSGICLIPSYTGDNTFPAYQDRLLMKSMGVQAGVVESEDFKVSAGTGLQVNVKKGKACVEQTKAIEESSNTFYNGLYNVLNPIEQNPYNNTEVSSVNNQIAQIVLRVYDVEELKTGGYSFSRLEWINGSPNALATEAKMKERVYEGRAELPQSSLRLANVLVPKNATKSSEYYIEDARESIFQVATRKNKYEVVTSRSANTAYTPSAFYSASVVLRVIGKAGEKTETVVKAGGQEVNRIDVNGEGQAVAASGSFSFITAPNESWEWVAGTGSPQVQSNYRILV